MTFMAGDQKLTARDARGRVRVPVERIRPANPICKSAFVGAV
jgi:hypothetical protein